MGAGRAGEHFIINVDHCPSSHPKIVVVLNQVAGEAPLFVRLRRALQSLGQRLCQGRGIKWEYDGSRAGRQGLSSRPDIGCYDTSTGSHGLKHGH